MPSKTHVGSGMDAALQGDSESVVLHCDMMVCLLGEFIRSLLLLLRLHLNTSLRGARRPFGRRSSHRLDTDYFVRPFRQRDAVQIRQTPGTRLGPSGTTD